MIPVCIFIRPHGMCDTLYRVYYGTRKVVCRIHFVFCASYLMRGLIVPIYNRVPHTLILTLHVYFGPYTIIITFPSLHPLPYFRIFLYTLISALRLYAVHPLFRYLLLICIIGVCHSVCNHPCTFF